MQHVFALVAFMMSGPAAFPVHLADSLAGTVYVTIAFWDLVFLAILLVIRRMCRACDNTIVPFVMAIAPASIAYIFGTLFDGLGQPASFWLVSYLAKLILASATLGKGVFFRSASQPV